MNIILIKFTIIQDVEVINLYLLEIDASLAICSIYYFVNSLVTCHSLRISNFILYSFVYFSNAAIAIDSFDLVSLVSLNCIISILCMQIILSWLRVLIWLDRSHHHSLQVSSIAFLVARLMRHNRINFGKHSDNFPIWRFILQIRYQVVLIPGFHLNILQFLL